MEPSRLGGSACLNAQVGQGGCDLIDGASDLRMLSAEFLDNVLQASRGVAVFVRGG